jgi:predicted dinucleotide-binding enzyme
MIPIWMETVMTMNIGIIGAGAIGSALARFAHGIGCEVMIANSRTPDTLSELAATVGARAVTARDAARANDLVVIAIAQKSVASLPRDLFAGAPSGSVVVDTGNYFPVTRDGRIPAIDNGLLDSEWVAEQIGRPVIKAFNMIEASSLSTLGRISGTPARTAIAIAGDDADAKTQVAKFIDQIGFDTVDAGSLSESWRYQPGTQAYCRDYDVLRLRAALGSMTRGRLAEYREECDAYVAAVVKSYGGTVAIQ